jgi:hypothetical protein
MNLYRKEGTNEGEKSLNTNSIQTKAKKQKAIHLKAFRRGESNPGAGHSPNLVGST